MSGRNLAEMARGLKSADLPDGGVTSVKLAKDAVGAAALDPSVTPAITKRTESGELAVTSAGTHSWEHGLGGTPKTVGLKLKCVKVGGVHGYAEGQVIPYETQFTSWGGANKGVAVKYNNTHVDVKFGSDTLCLTGIEFNTGAAIQFASNADWKLIMWADS